MIEHLVEQSREFDEFKQDYGPADVSTHFRMDGMGGLLVAPDLENQFLYSYEMTDWSFKQMCGRLGTVAHPGSSRSLPATYLLACPSTLRAENINHWIDQADGEWFVRKYKDRVRAILTNRYSTVDITETLTWVDEALKSGGQDSVQLVNPTVTPDVLHLKVLFQNVNPGNGNGDAPYAIGGYFTNGEIGNRRMGVYPLVQKFSCTNSIIIPHDEFSWDHIHVGRRQILKRTFVDSIFYVLEGAVEALERLLAATEPMPKFTEHLNDLVERRGWTIETRDKILLGSEGHESLFGLVQGVSSAANSVVDPDEQTDMQMMAGRLLMS